MSSSAHALIDAAVEAHGIELLALRRDLHAHPELSWNEQRTTEVVAARLEAAGLAVTRLPHTGLVVDIGDAVVRRGRRVALRADLDALPVDDLTTDPWVSTRPGIAHACGHDVHTAGLVGAGLALAEVHRRGELPGRVRLLFQPAEEVMPGGATSLIELGALDERRPDLLPPLRPDPRPRPGRGPRGSDHRSGRPARGPAHRQRRPHLAPAPHRGPHLRPRQADHRAARGAVAPPRPAGRRQRGVGHGPRGRRPQRGPGRRRRRRHRAHARRRGVVARRAAGARLHRGHRGAVRREGRGRLPPRRPARRQRRGRHRSCWPARSSGCSVPRAG